MSEMPEETDLALEISMATFGIRGHLTTIQGFGQLLKAYLEAQKELDSPVKIEMPIGIEITPQMAAQMIETILKSVHEIYVLQEELRRKASGSSEL